MQLLRTLAIIALVYYGFRFVRRVLFPFLLKALFKKAAKQNGGQFYNQSFNKQQQTQKEGDVHIEYLNNQKQTKRSSGDVGGEYVDFEEIKTD